MFLPISFGGLGLKSGMDKLLRESLHRNGRESISKGLVRLTGFITVECTPLPANCIPINGAHDSFNKLLGQAKPHDRSVLIQARDPHTGSIVTAKLTGSTELTDEAFSTALRLRLRLEQIPAGFRCQTPNCEYDIRKTRLVMSKLSGSGPRTPRLHP